MNSTNTSTQSKGKAPTHAVYHVREATREGGKGFWTKIGSAWPNRDGKGFSIQLDGLVPLDGRLTLRVIEEQRD